MLCGPVDIDDQIVEALENGELVVFAGAGVSMPPPSDLPSFAQLAKQIATKTRVPILEKEPEDRFLGRLEDGGTEIHVHRLARSLLIQDKSKHTELHELLLRIFRTPDKVRIVTTNFDSHFDTAAKKVFGDDSPRMLVHRAPALPLGDDFSGLIYLHGVLHEPEDRCVLTDRDFGAAYLTHGWARRFVLRLFSKYTVLFVGYSHDDTVMNYLARGMPATGRKFAFVPIGAESNWNFLRIKCISYSKYESEMGDNPHLQITEACRELAAEFELNPTERYERLKNLYERESNTLSKQEVDFICRCLRDEESAHGFFVNQPKLSWISWMLEAGLLDHLFNPALHLNDYQHKITLWVLNGFVEAEPLLWRKVQAFNFSLNPSTSRIIAIELQKGVHHESGIFRKWLAVLLNQAEGNLSREQLAWLMDSCQLPQEVDTALAILASQLKPRIETNSWDAVFAAEIGIETPEAKTLTLNTCAHGMPELRVAWDERLKPHLRDFSFLALHTFVALLIDHRSLAKLILPLDEEDIVSRGRENVEPGHEISGSDAIDLIITGTVQSLEAWLSSNSGSFDNFALAWNSMDVPILHRIVVHGQSKRPDWSVDQKLIWLTRQENVLHSPRNREANLLIQRHYASAREATRAEVIGWLESWGNFPFAAELTQRAFDAFSMISWLARNTVCVMAQEALARVSKMLPEGLHPWEHPEVGACSLPDSHFRPKPTDLAAISAAETPKNKLDALLEIIQIEKHRHQKYDLTHHAVKAGRDDVNWAIGFQNSLIEKGVFDAELWSVLFQLWREKELSVNEWDQLLKSWSAIHSPFVNALDLIADLLNGRIASQPYPIPFECRTLASEIAAHCWAETHDAPHEEPRPNDVVFFALNRAPGQLAHFWIRYASLLRQEAGDCWLGLPNNVTAALRGIATSPSIRSEIASVMLCVHFDQLYSLSSEFVIDHLLSKLMWPQGGTAALWRWDAFLTSGCMWPAPITDKLLPSFIEMLKKGALPVEARSHALDSAAWLTIYRFENPLDKGWFQQLLPSLTNEERIQFAHLVGVYLMKAQWENQTSYWHRWIFTYCQQRDMGIPASVSRDEAREILFWCLGSGNCFHDALQALLTWDVAPIQYSGPILADFEKSEHPEKHPDDSSKLLVRILDLCEGVLAKKSVTKIYSRLESAGASVAELARIRDATIKHGLNLKVLDEEHS